GGKLLIDQVCGRRKGARQARTFDCGVIDVEEAPFADDEFLGRRAFPKPLDKNLNRGLIELVLFQPVDHSDAPVRWRRALGAREEPEVRARIDRHAALCATAEERPAVTADKDIALDAVTEVWPDGDVAILT